MLTEHEKEIRIYTFEHSKEESKYLGIRFERLCTFIKHLGYLVEAHIKNETLFDYIIILIEPHNCSCDIYPYREKIKLTDGLNIENSVRRNNLKLVKIITLEEYIKKNEELELDNLEIEIDKFNMLHPLQPEREFGGKS